MIQLPPPDAAVPALRELLGPESLDIMSAAAVPAGFGVSALTTAQVRYVPGRYVVVQYRAVVTEADGTGSEPMLVAASGIDPPGPTNLIEDGAGTRIATWRFPNDPFLPGLAAAANRESARDLLARLGAETDGIRLNVRAYRATRRAVVEARGSSGTIYMKVLRPHKVEDLQERHAALSPQLPIPHSLGWSRRLGVVAMQALPGTTLRRSLAEGALTLPAPHALVAILDRLPPIGGATKPVAGAHKRFKHFSRLIRTVLPESSPLLDEIGSLARTAHSEDPLVPVHGDFHASQLLIASGEIVGLVDVDTAGMGQRVDDLANMLGQLATLALLADNPAPYEAYMTELLNDFDQRTDPAVLRSRVGFAIVGLATGPFRVQTADWPADTIRRLRLAIGWLNRATGNSG